MIADWLSNEFLIICASLLFSFQPPLSVPLRCILIMTLGPSLSYPAGYAENQKLRLMQRPRNKPPSCSSAPTVGASANLRQTQRPRIDPFLWEGQRLTRTQIRTIKMVRIDTKTKNCENWTVQHQQLAKRRLVRPYQKAHPCLRSDSTI